MNAQRTYAPAPFWDAYFAADAAAGKDLNPDGWWAPSFVPYLARYGVTTLLDLGCGTGGDSLVLARQGLHVTGMDYSQVALALPPSTMCGDPMRADGVMGAHGRHAWRPNRAPPA